MKAKRPRLKKVERETPSIVPEQIERLKELFPEAVSEGKVDFDKLRQTLGDEVDAGPERYSFTWAGKRDCIKLLQVPSRATLVPSPDESIDWDTTDNVFIEGENLEVLKLLYKAYYGRVKMIYIDPPYNTGKDFIYPDNYADPLDTYLRLTGQKDAEGNVLTSNPETSGRYHSAWLSMMYPRLFVARQLLRDDGVIFVSIDDNEVYNLRAAMNEVFGEENFIATVIWHKVDSPKNTAKHLSEDHDYIVVYARSAESWGPNLLARSEGMLARYKNADKDPRGPWLLSDLAARNFYAQGRYSITTPSGKVIAGPPAGSYWRVSRDRFAELERDNRIWWGTSGDNRPGIKRFLSEVRAGVVPQTYWSWKEVGSTRNAKQELSHLMQARAGEDIFITPKPTRLLERMLRLTTTATGGDVVVDFFAGTAPLAHATLNLNAEDGGDRRYVCVQLPEPLPSPEKELKTIADIGKERIRRVIAKMKKEKAGKLATDGPQDLGVRVYKLAESNMKPWKGTDEKDPEKYAKTMEMFLDPLVEGWKPENVIAEVALKEAGFGLNCRVEELNPQITQITQKDGKGQARKRTADLNHGSHVFKVADPDKEQFFYICLDDKVRLEDVKFLNLTRDMLFVCRDVALDDETAANLALQCRLRTI